MKKTTCAVLFFFLLYGVRAQTWSEWFRQKKTQIKYLTEQIAALKAYGEATWKGYTVAKEGLSAVGVFKEDDLALHGDYFASLRAVNAAVKDDDKVAQIIALQAAVLTRYESLKKLLQSSDALSPDEVRSSNKVLTNLLAGCADVVNKLLAITTDDASEMKDDERIARIGALCEDMQDKYAFLIHFSAETRLLLLQRRRDGADGKAVKGLFSIH